MNSKTSADKADSTLVKKVEQKAKEPLTLLWDDIPLWMRDNQYVQTGYRPVSNSYSKSAGSIIYLHNESVNIWSHLIGAALAAVTAIFMYNIARLRFEMATREDVVVFSCFFFGAVACLSMSATFHTLLNHSEAVTNLGQRLEEFYPDNLLWIQS